MNKIVKPTCEELLDDVGLESVIPTSIGQYIFDIRPQCLSSGEQFTVCGVDGSRIKIVDDFGQTFWAPARDFRCLLAECERRESDLRMPE